MNYFKIDLDTKKNLTSNWFKTLQNSFCEDIINLEKNLIKFKSTNWKKSFTKMKAEVSTEFYKMEKFLIKLE